MRAAFDHIMSGLCHGESTIRSKMMTGVIICILISFIIVTQPRAVTATAIRSLRESPFNEDPVRNERTSTHALS